MRDFPIQVFLVSLVALLFVTWIGGSLLRRLRTLDDDSRADYTGVVAATLTLLGLIIGFSFSMAIARYDLRKNYEEAEANAIGTEFARADLLPAGDAQRVRGLLTNYLDLRIRDYESRDEAEIRRLEERTSRLQGQLWSAVRDPATAQPNPVAALAVSGMNDVLNSQSYTQAAWWNRIPRSAWWLMTAIAAIGCALVGYGARAFRIEAHFNWVLPTVISISFLLIADIDSPRHGLIRVAPQNLIALSKSLHASVANPRPG